MNWSQDTYLKAFHFAARAHQGQIYPGTELPYIMHLSFVCMEVIAAFHFGQNCDENLAIQCALLHDSIEDTAVTYEQIKDEFGEAVAGGVLALTKDATVEKSQRMQDSLQRLLSHSREAQMVKLADRITNLQRPPAHWNRDKIISYREEARMIHTALKDADEYLAARLLQKIEAYKTWTEEP